MQNEIDKALERAEKDVEKLEKMMDSLSKPATNAPATLPESGLARKAAKYGVFAPPKILGNRKHRRKILRAALHDVKKIRKEKTNETKSSAGGGSPE